VLLMFMDAVQQPACAAAVRCLQPHLAAWKRAFDMSKVLNGFSIQADWLVSHQTVFGAKFSAMQ